MEQYDGGYDLHSGDDFNNESGDGNNERENSTQVREIDPRIDQAKSNGENIDDYIGAAPSMCEVCGDAIPSTDTRCPTHRQMNEIEAPDYLKDSLGIYISIVEAENKYHALALGGAATGYMVCQNPQIDEITLLYDCEDEDLITKLEGDLGAELGDVEQITDSKHQLLKEAFKSSEQENVVATVANQDQKSITALTDGTKFIESADKEVWLVPGVCHTVERNLEGETVRKRPCEKCADLTDHILIKKDKMRDVGKKAQWECIECQQRHWDVEPSKKDQIDHYSTFEGKDNPETTPNSEQFKGIINNIEGL